MKCPFCAEEIQEAAILCRFCNSRKVDGEWVTGDSLPKSSDSNFTIKTSGVLFLIGAVFSVFSLTSPVVYFNTFITGPIAITYSIFYVIILAAVGTALWNRKPWAMPTVYAFTALYTVEKLDPIFFSDPMLMIKKQAGKDVLDMVGGEETLGLIAQITYISCLLLWYGFAVYLWYKRDYFRPAKAP